MPHDRALGDVSRSIYERDEEEYDSEESSEEEHKLGLFRQPIISENTQIEGTPLKKTQLTLYDAMMRELKIDVIALNDMDLNFIKAPKSERSEEQSSPEEP